jgi:hypothetical protein
MHATPFRLPDPPQKLSSPLANASINLAVRHTPGRHAKPTLEAGLSSLIGGWLNNVKFLLGNQIKHSRQQNLIHMSG